ncbi:hypothetical protein LCGC14_0491500 [marine sediment metagenome]|uniref:Uncharacterized protein n=1 Tax=marine sediment metagenome TaxID=412755 RepID=A0A0F9SPV1_9ZZZZ
METYVKFANKDLNLSLLRQQLEESGLGEAGILFAGFTSIRRTYYTPNLERQVIATRTEQDGSVTTKEADPGELRIKFETVLTFRQEAALDGVLSDHDATQLSILQIAKKKDIDSLPDLINSIKDWDTLNPQMKDAALRQGLRLIVRLQDKSVDI